jgi:hypothetical protein
MPSRSGKSQILLAYHAYHVYHYHLTVNPPESPRHERASISVRLGDLGFISGWLEAEDKIFMQISLSFQMPIRIWNYSEKQTDNRKEIYSKLLAHSEQIFHSARRYLSTHFFCWFDKIYVKIMLIWLRFWTAGWRLRFWEMDIFGRLILFYCAPARICITRLLVMAMNFNWFIKITRSFGSGFQIQNIAKPKVRLIMIRTNLSRHSYQIRLRNTLVLNWWLIHCLLFFFLC